MELAEFRKDFIESVKAAAAASGDFEEGAFVSEASRRLIDAEELDGFEPCHFVGTGARNRRMRVDGYWFDEVDGSVCLLISRYTGGDEVTVLGRTETAHAFAQLKAFIADAFSGRLLGIEQSSPGYGLATDLYHRQDQVPGFRAYLLTDTLLTQRVKEWPEETLEGRPIRFHIWDIARFHRVYESGVGRGELEVDFTEFANDGIPCLEASQEGEDYKAYLCVLPGAVLADLYDRFGSRLLEGNVRAFLSTKVKVNKSIRTSIIEEPGMFFAYNNGIAATATSAVVNNGPQGLRLLRASYLQIVNGGQTTASLASTRRKDGAELDNIFVQMKLSVVTPQNAESIVPKIAYCANSQNKVSEADFFSNHPFHIRMEEISRRLWAPATGGAQHETHWFYERARGQYLNEQGKLTLAGKKMFLFQNPRSQVITKTDLAKYENLWRELPHTVSFGAQKNFLSFAQWIDRQWKADDTVFTDGFFHDAVGKAILFRHVERLVSNQPWYQGGYRANIVAYTLAKLVNMIREQAPGKQLDLKSIWATSKVPEPLNAQLVSISKAAFEVITHPGQGIQNVTEWSKKEACWERMKARDVQLGEKLLLTLVDTAAPEPRD
jgi:hypothetical protein